MSTMIVRLRTLTLHEDYNKNKDHEWLHHIFKRYGRRMRVLTIHWPVVLKAVIMIAGENRNTLQSQTSAIVGKES